MRKSRATPPPAGGVAGLESLITRTSLLFSLNSVDEILKAAGRILCEEFGLPNVIFRKDGGECVLVYIAMSDVSMTEGVKVTGIDPLSIAVPYDRRYFGRMERGAVFKRDSRDEARRFVLFHIKHDKNAPRADKRVVDEMVEMAAGSFFPAVSMPSISCAVECGGEVFGFISVFGPALSRRDIPAMTSFANIVGAAAKASAAIAAAEKRMTVERAVSRVSSRFASAPNIDEALDMSLAEIGKVSGADRAYLFSIEDSGMTMSNTHEWCAAGVEPQIDNLQKLETDTLPWWMRKLRNGETINITDVSKLPAEAAAEREILEAQDIKSLVVLPITMEGRLDGFIGFDKVRDNKKWGENDLFLLRTSSEIIGSAIQLRNSLEALKSSEERYRQLFELSPDPITLVGRDGRVIGVNKASETTLGLTAEQIEGKPFWEIHTLDMERIPEYMAMFNDVLTGKTTGNVEISVRNAAGDDIWLDTHIAEYREGGVPAGFQVISRNVTDQVHNSRQLRELSKKILSTQEEERKNISRELHDNLGQRLTAMSILVELLREQPDKRGEYVKELADMVKDVSEEVRRVCKGLRPIIMDRAGLATAVESLVWEFDQRWSGKVDLRIFPFDGEPDPQTSINVYRILQEALSNVAKHSKAGSLSVFMGRAGESLELEVRDNGQGFRIAAMNNIQGFGIIGMMERANLCGGSLEIGSEPGKGTTLRVTVPFK